MLRLLMRQRLRSNNRIIRKAPDSISIHLLFLQNLWGREHVYKCRKHSSVQHSCLAGFLTVEMSAISQRFPGSHTRALNIRIVQSIQARDWGVIAALLCSVLQCICASIEPWNHCQICMAQQTHLFSNQILKCSRFMSELIKLHYYQKEKKKNVGLVNLCRRDVCLC